MYILGGGFELRECYGTTPNRSNGLSDSDNPQKQ